jgi:hypothetical protein
MIFRRALFVGLAVAALPACQDHSLEDPADGRRGLVVQAGSCTVRGDLTAKDDVLCNLEFSYRYRDLNEFSRLTDPTFVFYFSPSDVGNGIPEQWGLTDELSATDKMFGSPPTGIRDGTSDEELPTRLDIQEATWGFIKAYFRDVTEPATSISLNLDFTPGEDDWLLIGPGEVYLKFAYYTIEVVTGTDTFISPPLRAAFAVKQVEVQGQSIWRLVEWRDDT